MSEVCTIFEWEITQGNVAKVIAIIHNWKAQGNYNIQKFQLVQVIHIKPQTSALPT